MGGVVTGGGHRSRRDTPHRRSFGGRHVDDRVVLLVGCHRIGELERGQRRRKHQDSRRLPREGDPSHPLAKIRALGAAVARPTLAGEDTIHAATHKDVARNTSPTCLHPQLTHLRAQLDNVQPGVRQPRGDPHGVGDLQFRQVHASFEGSLPDGLKTGGQNDTTQGHTLLEGFDADLGGSGGDHHLCRHVGRREAHQGRGPRLPAIEGTIRHKEGGIGGADADGRKTLILIQRVVPEGGQRRTNMERGQRRHLREGLPLDVRH